MLPPSAADMRGDRAAGCAPAPSTDQRILVAEQPVGGALHVRDVLGMRADAAEDAEHRLDEERRLDQPAVGEMGERVEMADVVALELEARAVVGAGRQDVLDVLEGVVEDAVARGLEMRPLPVELEVLDSAASIG